MSVAREGGVVRHPAVEPEVTKPAIGQIEMDLLAKQYEDGITPATTIQPQTKINNIGAKRLFA